LYLKLINYLNQRIIKIWLEHLAVSKITRMVYTQGRHHRLLCVVRCPNKKLRYVMWSHLRKILKFHQGVFSRMKNNMAEVIMYIELSV